MLFLSQLAPPTLFAQQARDRSGLPTRDEVQRLPASELLPRILDVKQEARRTVNPTLYFNSLFMEVEVYHDYGMFAEADSVLNDVFDDLETDGITVRMTEEQMNNLRYQYAWTLNYQLKYAEAFDVLMPLFEEDLDRKFESNILTLRATLYSNLGLFDEAIKDNLASIELLEKLKDRRALATAYNNLGLQNHEIGDYRTAIEHFMTSLELAADLDQPTILAGYYSNTGLSYTAIDSFDVAEQYFTKALDISRQTSNPLILAQSLLNIGTVFSGRFQDERALEYFQESMELSRTHNLRYGILLNSVNLAFTLHRLERFEEADPHFVLAESMLSETIGPELEAFEHELTVAVDRAHAVCVTTGTAAIHLGLITLDVQPGDEVIVQDFTFCGSVNPVRYLGAEPVLIDSEPGSWNMCPHALREGIDESIRRHGRPPKAIIPVHLYGMPARIGDILAVAAEYGVPVLEDAAEALGSRLSTPAATGPCGSIGELSIVSFNGNKIITTSGGGALFANDPAHTRNARFLATQARDEALHYQHSHLGYNYRMSNVLAAIGRAQLRRLSDRVAARRAIFARYAAELGDLPGLYFGPSNPPGVISNRWLTTLLVDPSQTGGLDHNAICRILSEQQIECRPLWKPMHRQPLYESARFHACPEPVRASTNGASIRFLNAPSGWAHSALADSPSVSDFLFDRGLCLPSGSGMTPAQQTRVIHAIRSLFA